MTADREVADSSSWGAEVFGLHDVRVLMPDGGFSDELDVVVRSGVIERVAPRMRRDSEMPVLDGAGLWLMPGIVDCHIHGGFSTSDTLENLSTPLSLRTLRAARNLGRTLRAGVTLARDAGGLDAGVRTAIDEGLIDGPNLKLSIVLIGQTGGHVDGLLAGPASEFSVEYLIPDYPGRPSFIVDGEDEMRRAVRQVLRAGGDWIKVCTTGGVFRGLEAAGTPQLSEREVRVAVVEAAKQGRSVMAHALGGAGLDIALAAGVRSIEHGLLITEEQAAAMAAAGCTLVPTLAVYAEIADGVRRGQSGLTPTVAATALELERRFADAIGIARSAGVRITLGSDFGSAALHGCNLREISLLHQAGLTVEEALLAATAVGSELLGEGDRRGRLAPGYVFDAVLLDEDPGDLTLFERPDAVTGVFLAGEPAVAHPRLSASRFAWRRAGRSRADDESVG